MSDEQRLHITYKADRLMGGETPSARLEIDRPIPAWPAGLPHEQAIDQLRRQYRQEAIRIVDLFSEHMPGGLIDAIAVEMLERQASVLKVPYGKNGSDR